MIFVELVLGKMRNNGGKEKEQRWDEKDPRSGPALDAHFAT